MILCQSPFAPAVIISVYSCLKAIEQDEIQPSAVIYHSNYIYCFLLFEYFMCLYGFVTSLTVLQAFVTYQMIIIESFKL